MSTFVDDDKSAMTQPQQHQIKPGLYYCGTFTATCPGCNREVSKFITLRFPDEQAFGCKECHTPLFRIFVNHTTGYYDYEFFS